MTTLRYGSVFSGIGGFEAGLDAAGGMKCVWQVENDPDAVRVLGRHWPGARRYSDVKEIDAARLEPVDLVCGGPPCQDWSVAGKRAGISGARGGLFFDFVRVADAVAPRWVLMENVPGLLHAGKPRGTDFATVLEHLSGFRPAVPEGGWRSAGVCSGPKRHVCWRVLDARFFGVPQRRRRVFLVASAPDASCVEILFEPSGGGGHPAPGREEGAGLAPAVTPGARRASGQRGGEQLTVAGTVNADPGRKGCAGDDTHLIASPVMAHGGIHERQQTFVTACDVRNNVEGPVSHTLQSGDAPNDAPLVSHALTRRPGATEDGTGPGTPLVIQPNGSDVQTGATPGPLMAAPTAGGPVVAFNWQDDHNFRAEDGLATPLRVSQTEAVAYQCHGSNVGPMGTVRSGNGGLTGGVPFVAESYPGGEAKADKNAGPVGFRCGCGALFLGEMNTPCPACGGFGGTATYPPGRGGCADGWADFMADLAAADPPPAEPIPLDMRQASRGATMTNNRGGGVASGGAPGTGVGEAGDPAPSLAETHTPAVAFTVNAHNSCATQSHARESDTARCLDGTGGYAPGQGGTLAFQERGRDGGPNVETQADLAYSLNAPAGGHRRQEMSINAGMVVRRLTPTECLRLMGQPDYYLDLDPPLSDSAKYRLIGNSVVRPVAAWLGRRIALALSEDTPGA